MNTLLILYNVYYENYVVGFNRLLHFICHMVYKRKITNSLKRNEYV